MASRLSEIENWNVLLVEAGGDETELSDVPLLAGFLQLSQLDWKYRTEPQGDACLGNFYCFCVIYTFEKLTILEIIIQSRIFTSFVKS